MKIIKRLIDMIISISALIILSPIMLILIILIYFKLGYPVFFVQERIGKDNKVFKMIKFRTMRDIKNKKGELLSDAERLTSFGKLIRSLSLDELPELINIIKGDMSIVGPRPLLVEYLPLYNEREIKRHNVLPGLTGWAQVNGRNLLSWNERFEHDVWYVENWSLLLDIKIFFKTILKVFKREGINQEGSVTMEKFTGSDKKLKDIVIIGAGGFGREVAWLIEEINEKEPQWNIIGFIDDDRNKKGEILNGYKILGDLTTLENRTNLYFTCAIGNSKIKAILAEKSESLGLKPATLIHPNVGMGNYNDIGIGNIICAGNIITVNIKTGKYVTINLSCTIGHDVVIKDYVTVYPSVSISGNCNIGDKVEIGTRSAIIQGLSIGRGAILGAGAVVVKNIPEYCTAVGAPAKPIKFSNMEE